MRRMISGHRPAAPPAARSPTGPAAQHQAFGRGDAALAHQVGLLYEGVCVTHTSKRPGAPPLAKAARIWPRICPSLVLLFCVPRGEPSAGQASARAESAAARCPCSGTRGWMRTSRRDFSERWRWNTGTEAAAPARGRRRLGCAACGIRPGVNSGGSKVPGARAWRKATTHHTPCDVSVAATWRPRPEHRTAATRAARSAARPGRCAEDVGVA